MKNALAAACLATIVVLSGCGEKAVDADEAVDTARSAEAPVVADADATKTAEPAVLPVQSQAPTPVAGAPDFAVIYPGGEIQGDVTFSPGGSGAVGSGPGGIVTFITASTPAQVVGFYRQRAEAAGLSSVMAMSQGDTQAYGAHSPGTGANLSVVASVNDDDQTSVQLSWSAGV